MPDEGPVHLRRATVEDAAGIAKVHSEGWRRAHAGLVPTGIIDSAASGMREEFWLEELKVGARDRLPWVALLDGRIIGFASGGMARDEGADPGTGEIYLLFVAPEYWDRGIRTNLIEHVVMDLQDHDFERAVFWVLAADDVMRSFAEYVGFSTDGTRRYEDCGGTKVEQLRYTLELR